MRDPLHGLVLVVSARGTDDDRAIHGQLLAAGFGVRCICDVPSAMHFSQLSASEVLILAPDVVECAEYPDALTRVRRAGFVGMILVVGKNTAPSAAAVALDGGADDYVALSRAPTELVARVRALARRAAGAMPLEREVGGGVVLDLRHGVLRRDGTEVALTRREADLFDYLARHAGQPVSREELAAQIWHAASPANGSTNIVDVYVSYLRRKLATLGRQSLIRSVRRVGYELVETRH
jgi:DNA-binding response OmpR family regulator